MPEGSPGTALVTGATGLMGRALVAELEASGAGRVVGASSADADLTDFDATLALLERHRPAVVFHLAARVSGIMGNLRAQGRAYLDNVRINTNVVEAARLAGARKIVAMGSTAVYSDMVGLPMREEEIWLGPPHASEAGYAHAKRGMLAQLESYRDQYGMDYAFCVSTNLFGMHDKFDEAHGHVLPSLISKFHRAAREDTAVTVWGTGTPRRDFLYVKDAALAMRLIAERFTGPINLASGEAHSIREVAEMIHRISGGRQPLLWDPSKPDGQKLRGYDVGKLRTLSFRPRHGLEEALRETYDWFAGHAETARR